MNDKLSNDPLFLLSFWGGLSLGFLLYILLILNNKLILCFDLICYKNFLEIFTLPISTATGGMALAAFRATIFRSNQTRLQIEETLRQNTFKNYIDHKKEFINVLEMLESSHSIEIINKAYLYKNIFPENNPTCIRLDSKELDCDRSWIDFQIDKFNKVIDQYNEIGSRICVDDQSLSDHAIARWLGDTLLLIHILDIRFSERKTITSKYKGFFSDSDDFNSIPSDINKSIYVISDYFKHISTFALPSRKEKIAVNGIASFDERFNERLKVFTNKGITSKSR